MGFFFLDFPIEKNLSVVPYLLVIFKLVYTGTIICVLVLKSKQFNTDKKFLNSSAKHPLYADNIIILNLRKKIDTQMKFIKYRISGNFRDYLIFAFFMVSFKSQNIDLQKLYLVLFHIRNI